MSTRLRDAILNNVAWCEEVARSHGLSCERNSALWICRQRMPRLYPNMISLDATATITHEVAALDKAVGCDWGFKDSFANFELEEVGFRCIVHGSWYAREPNTARRIPVNSARTVRPVRTASELEHWNHAWSESLRVSTAFLPALLSSPGVEFVLARVGEVAVAGMATNATGQVVGVTNMFGQLADVAACIEFAARKHPEKALVGYGGEEEVAQLAALGFVALGPVRVWLRG